MASGAAIKTSWARLMRAGGFTGNTGLFAPEGDGALATAFEQFFFFGSQSLQPALFTNEQTFFSATVTQPNTVGFVGRTSAAIPGFTSGNTSVPLTSLTGGNATQPSEGDIIVVAYSMVISTSNTITIKDAALLDYSPIGSQQTQIDVIPSGRVGMHVAYKFAGGTPDTEVLVGPMESANFAGSVNIEVWSGIDPTTPLDVTPTTASGNGTTAANPAAITPATDDARIIAVGAAINDADATGTISAGYSSSDLTQFNSQIGNDNLDVVSGMGYSIWTSGAFNPAAFTGATDSADGAWVAKTFALRPSGATLSPPLVTNSQTFYAPTVTTSNSLAPSLLTNDQTFYSPTVTTSYSLTAPLVTNGQTFFSPTVSPGAATVSPSLFTNSQSFPAATVTASNTLSPSLVTNNQTFYSPTVSLGGQFLSPSLFTNNQTFFGPTVTASYALAPSLFTNTQTFFGPTVTASNPLSPSLFTNSQTFYGPTVSPGAVSLSPPLVTNSQTFPSATLTNINTLAPSLVTNSQTFYAPTITQVWILSPSLFTNDQTFFSPTVEIEEVTVNFAPAYTGQVIHAELQPLDAGLGSRVTVRATNANIASETGLNNQIWRPAIPEAPKFGIRLFKGDFDGRAEPAGGTLTIEINQLEALDADVRGFLWAGSPVTIYAGEIGSGWPRTQVFDGIVAEAIRADGNRLVIPIEVDTEPFNADILTSTYAGTSGAEGGEDIKGKPKPWLLGRCFNVEPILINATDSVYQFSAYGAISAVTKLYERGSDFGTSYGDYANYAALVAAAIPEGRWATCLAAGMVRLGAPAVGVITGDVDGDAVGSWRRKTGEIINRVATNAGAIADVDTASLTALDTAVAAVAASNEGRIGVYLTEQESLIDFAARLAAPCNAQVGVSLLGKLFVSRPDIGSPVATLDAQQRQMPRVASSIETGVSPPFSKIEMGYARSWRVHTKDEIAYDAELIERGLYSGSEVYREGNIVSSADGSRWVYINATPGSGNAPPTWPTTSSSYWSNLTPPTAYAIPSVAIRGAEILNPRNTSNVSRRLLEATDAGASVTISVARHDWDYPDGVTDVTRELGTITGLSFSTRYYVYFDDTTLANGSPTYVATTNYETALNTTANSGRHFVGSVRTPADGGTATNEFNITIADAAILGLNDSNGKTPDATGSITSVTQFLVHADARVSYEGTFTFAYNADPNHKNNVDGFAIGWFARDSASAYTMLGPGTVGENWRVEYMALGAANYTRPFLQQVDPTKYYTIAVAPFRKVAATTVVESLGTAGRGYEIGPIVQHGPFRPSSTQAISGTALTINGQTANDVGTGTGRAMAAITSSNKAATNVVETISLNAETVTHLFLGATSSTEIALDGSNYGTYVSVGSSSFTVQEGGADVAFLFTCAVRFGISVTDSNLQFTATARITFDSVNSNTFEVTQTVYAAGRQTTVPITVFHLFEGVSAGSKTFTLEIKVDDPGGTGDYAETRGVRTVQIMELKR